MRSQESITKLLYNLYTGHEWVELEEYFIVAEQLILLHGGHFRILDDVFELHDNEPFAHLAKYSDSEEAWREEINKIENIHFMTFESITNVFIYFNK